jgi:hypothetical protein
MNKPDNLHSAIENVYRVFNRYPLRHGHPIPCPCCTSKEDVAQLHSKPLRQLTDKDLDKYGFKAMTTWGDVEDFKHYLPRLLELLLTNNLNFGFGDPVQKLAYGQWRTWPQEEQDAIEACLCALWESVLVTEPDPFDVGGDLMMIAALIDDLDPLLQHWQQLSTTSKTALASLAYFVIHLWHYGGFHMLKQEQIDQTKAWVWSPAIREILESAFFRFSEESPADGELVQLLSDAVLGLDTLKDLFDTSR